MKPELKSALRWWEAHIWLGKPGGVSVEAASPLGWERYVGLQGKVIGLDRFGASAPAETIYRELGLDAGKPGERAMATLEAPLSHSASRQLPSHSAVHSPQAAHPSQAAQEAAR